MNLLKIYKICYEYVCKKLSQISCTKVKLSGFWEFVCSLSLLAQFLCLLYTSLLIVFSSIGLCACALVFFSLFVVGNFKYLVAASFQQHYSNMFATNVCHFKISLALLLWRLVFPDLLSNSA